LGKTEAASFALRVVLMVDGSVTMRAGWDLRRF